MNAKGKGKPKKKGQATPFYEPGPTSNKEDGEPSPTCGICMETFHATHSPVAASRSANSSSRLQFGTYLPCPRSHGYCHSCLNGYINSKLDPDGTGVGSQSNVVFPIRCPECSIAEWPDGIPNGIAERVLSEKGMNLWVRSSSFIKHTISINAWFNSITRSFSIAFRSITAPTHDAQHSSRWTRILKTRKPYALLVTRLYASLAESCGMKVRRSPTLVLARCSTLPFRSHLRRVPSMSHSCLPRKQLTFSTGIAFGRTVSGRPESASADEGEHAS